MNQSPQQHKIDQMYSQYKNLSSKIKKRRIEQAIQKNQFKKQNPQKNCHYPEQNFIDLIVGEKVLVKLATYRYAQGQNIRGVIHIFNGLNFCSIHSAHIAKKFSQQGYAVVSFDYRGFGKSEGEPGCIDSLQNIIQDSIIFIQQVDKIYSNLPKFAIGLSLGGLIVYHLALRYDKLFNGVILLSALIKPMVGQFICTLATTISKLLPKARIFSFTKGISTKNQNVSDDLANDPYYYKQKIPAKTYKLLLNALNQCYKTFPKFKTDLMIVQGGLDKIVNPDGAFQLYDKCNSKNKQIHFYENMWHDAFHEQQIYDILPKMVSWIKKLCFQTS